MNAKNLRCLGGESTNSNSGGGETWSRSGSGHTTTGPEFKFNGSRSETIETDRDHRRGDVRLQVFWEKCPHPSDPPGSVGSGCRGKRVEEGTSCTKRTGKLIFDVNEDVWPDAEWQIGRIVRVS